MKFKPFLMTDYITIPSKYTPLLKDFYKKKVEDNTVLISKIEAENRELIAFLNSIDSTPLSTEQKFTTFSDGYDTKWSLIDKSIFIIKTYGDSTLIQIADRIRTIYEKTIDFTILKNNLSAVLSVDAKKYNKLKRYRNEAKKWVYEINDLK